MNAVKQAIKSAELRYGTTNKRNEKNARRSRLQGQRQHPLPHFQQTIGNRALGQFLSNHAIQAKLTIGQPSDRFEKEADRVADQVMRMPNPQGLSLTESSITSPDSPAGIQRVCSSCQHELQRMPVPTISTITSNSNVQRACAECEDELKRQPEEEEELLQAKENPGATPQVTPPLEAGVNSLKGGGRPLSDSQRAFFEPRFGADFSQVRVHTGNPAGTVSRSINARAFTIGNNIAFGSGQYAPSNGEGNRLLAHELAHVIQQGAAQANISRAPVPIQFSTDSSTQYSISRQEKKLASDFQTAGSRSEQTPKHFLAAPASIQRECGSAIGEPQGCITPPDAGHFRPGTVNIYRFAFECDTFVTGHDRTLVDDVRALPVGSTVEIHGYASVEDASSLGGAKAGINHNLSCARAIAAESLLTAPEPVGAGLPAWEIVGVFAHGATPGPVADRRSVTIETYAPTPAPVPPTPVPPTPTPTPAPRGWWSVLPDCPCMNPGIATLNDGWCSEGATDFHPGAAECYRGINTTQGPGQQCCYDANGCLITAGAGAGTPDRVGVAEGENADGSCDFNNFWGIQHGIEDVLPFDPDNVEEYHRDWPPNQGNNCSCPTAGTDE